MKNNSFVTSILIFFLLIMIGSAPLIGIPLMFYLLIKYLKKFSVYKPGIPEKFIVNITKDDGSVENKEVVEASVENIYFEDEKLLLKKFIDEELAKNNFDKKSTISYIEKRKTILTIIFSTLNLIFISFYFFHLPIWTCTFFILNIILYFVFVRKIDINKYLIKQIKGRPDDNISDIISSTIQDIVPNNLIKKIGIVLVSIIIPLIIFSKPRFFYEKTENGYYVRFYTIGLKNDNTITIPETHNGKNVIGIRGNVFANIKSVKTINLPNTIEVIRGKAFKNDTNLETINLPANLTYLGGSAFKNCTSLKSITIPNGVTEINGSTFEGCKNLSEVNLHDNIITIHGSAFKDCRSLKNITLPSEITEIRGNTFENCTSLRTITIPDYVTRIGGHAFYGDSLLSEVKFTPNSQLREIGSSAFRKCYSLNEITLPNHYIYINQRAFKESPTIQKKFNENNNTISNTNPTSSIDTSGYAKSMEHKFTLKSSIELDNGKNVELSYISSDYFSRYSYYFYVTKYSSNNYYYKRITLDSTDNFEKLDDMLFQVISSDETSMTVRIYYN